MFPWSVSQQKVERCRAGKSFCRVFHVIWPFLLQCSAQLHQLLLNVPQWWFRWVGAANILHQLIPPNTEHELGTMNIRLCRRCWWFACTMIFCILDYRIYFSSSVTIRCKKLFLLCLWSNNSQIILRFSMSLGFNSYDTQFLCFWIIPMAFKCLEIVDRSTFNDSVSFSYVWLESWS